MQELFKMWFKEALVSEIGSKLKRDGSQFSRIIKKKKILLYGHLEPIVADSLKDNVENSSSLSYAMIEVAEELIF